MLIKLLIAIITGRISISKGNKKTGPVLSVSLLPILSCEDGIACKKDCYAIKNMSHYVNVHMSWARNWNIWLTKPKDYFQQIKGACISWAGHKFRYHIGGDIPDVDYFNRMVALAKELPDTPFLAMTKRRGLDLNNLPSNLTILYSAWPGSPIPEEYSDVPIAYMQDGTENRIGKNSFECKGWCINCSKCWDARKLGIDIVFPKH